MKHSFNQVQAKVNVNTGLTSKLSNLGDRKRLRLHFKIRTLMLFICLLSLGEIYPQGSITIDSCYKKAVENYPLIKQSGLIEKSKQLSLENINNNYLPQFSLNGQATYQSDVTTIPINFAALGLPISIDALSKDQYKATIDVNQIIWDGGINAAQKKTINASAYVDKQKTEVNLYAVQDKITQLYFGILSINERIKILSIKELDISTNKTALLSLVKNGAATQSDMDLINVELLNIDQQTTELKYSKQAFCQMLSLFTHLNITDSTRLATGLASQELDKNITRPELALFNYQSQLLNSQRSSLNAKNRPRIGLFAQGGYGRPGLNMLEDKFKLFAIGGIKLSWNFGSLYSYKNENKLIDNNLRIIDTQRESFILNTQIQMTQELSEIEKYKNLLIKDDDVILLRSRIKNVSESKFKNGVYETKELIKDINAEEQARQSKSIHQIQYLLKIAEYKYIKGLNN